MDARGKFGDHEGGVRVADFVFVCCSSAIPCRYVVKDFVRAFSCGSIELWTPLGSLESTREAELLSTERPNRIHNLTDIQLKA